MDVLAGVGIPISDIDQGDKNKASPPPAAAAAAATLIIIVTYTNWYTV